MDKVTIEKAYNDTFPGLTMYYKDCELKEHLIHNYTIDQILMERGFTDVSSFAKGLSKNVRYAIASNKAVNMSKVNPDVSRFGFHLISAPSYYKVLDMYTIKNQTQILLLHFEKEYIDIFKSMKSNIEKNIIKMGRQSLDKKIKMRPSEVLYEKAWLDRTQLPIGMSDNGEFFYQ